MNNDAVEKFIESMRASGSESNKSYKAIVSRVDAEGVVWVNLAGTDKETPTASTSAEVKRGDVVTVEWQNNKLYIAGNYSDPSAGVARVRDVEIAANTAKEAANNAIMDAGRAREAADQAEATAESVRGIAVDAQTNAGIAKTAADKAVKDLSQVENVVGVVNWIAEHGTMTSQAGQAFDANKVYFVVDPNGDYVIGSTHYSVVAEPKAEDIDTYYLLSIDESVQNYVMTHVYVDSEGLWLIPEQSGGNKILIAVGGTGHTYPVAGTYIIGKVNGQDTVLAQFLANAAQVGASGAAHTIIDSDGQRIYASDGTTQLANIGYEVGSSAQSQATRVPYFSFGLNARPPAQPYSENYPYHFGDVCIHDGIYHFCIADTSGAWDLTKWVSAIGQNSTAEGWFNSAVGIQSHAEGGQNVAYSYNSHVEGGSCRAVGDCSHAEGEYSRTGADWAHAQNYNTRAMSDCQTVIGRSNVPDPEEKYALIIGNGDFAGNPSNGLTVDWDGNVKTHNDEHELVAVKSGTNNSWSYRIYADGRMEAEKDITTGASWSTVGSSGIAHNTTAVTPPTGMTVTGGYANLKSVSQYIVNAQIQVGSTVNLEVHRLATSSTSFTCHVTLTGKYSSS